MGEPLTEADNGRTIELQVHDRFKILLRESRMGGYRWNLVEAGEPVLTPTEVKNQSAPLLPGQANVRAWQFTAQQPGSARIQLQHRRPWEKGGSGHDFSLNVNVAA